ncbi:MAG: transporter substrate-binding domain-containing protein [Burkholderiales bacterium]
MYANDSSAAGAAKAAAARELAPSGRLRAAINLGNPVLAHAGAAGADPGGISVDLARAVARDLGIGVELVPYPSAGAVIAAATRDAWDMAFLAAEPERASSLAFSPPYVEIDGTYLVRASAPFATCADVDRADVTIAVAQNAAYDLHLTRTLAHAQPVRAPDGAASLRLFDDARVTVAAGIRQALDRHARGRADLRVLPDRFMAIRQAIAVAKTRQAAAAYLASFVTTALADGTIARIVASHAAR